MRPKLSIIIPVYNVEKYLRKCVDSLLAQDLPVEDYEIILVDDGSTDGSVAICDEYAQLVKSEKLIVKSINIRVIHQANAGVGAARNAGLKVAKGEYVCFVDSDDYWEPNVLGTLMAQVEREKLDVLRFDYQNVRIVNSEELIVNSEGLIVNSGKYEVFEPNKYPHQVDRRNEVVDGETYLNTRMGYACYPVMYIVKRSLLIGNLSLVTGDLAGKDCLFTEGIHFEDTEWLPRMMLRAKRVNNTPLIVYNYLLHQGSITQVRGQKEKLRQNIEDCMTVIAHYNAYIVQYPNCLWLRKMRGSIVSFVLTSVAREFYTERKEYIARLKSMSVFPLTIADQGKTYVRRAVLVNLFGSRLYCALLHLKNRI